ncbi:MAG: two-component system activity regulator YycH [Lactobacillus iners]|nr:two-component system activity regulator YycH [Lactobacillus iners]
MKFSDKCQRIVLRISLSVMVLLSIILSGYIWGSDTRFSRMEQDSNQPAIKKNVGQKSLREIYTPTQVFYYRDKQLYQAYDAKRNLTLEFSKFTKKLEGHKINKIKSNSTFYRQLLHDEKYFQLTFPDQITISLFLPRANKYLDGEFNRIFVSTKDKKYLYLGDDRNNTLYRVYANVSFKNLYKHIQKAASQIPISLEKLKDGFCVSYNKDQQMAIYSYLTYKETDAYFVYKLLDSGNPTQRNADDYIAYYNGIYQRLVAYKKTHNYEFVDYQQNKIPNTTTKMLTDSLFYVRKICLNEPDLRFFDASNNTISYQKFVEEYPVFLPEDNNVRAKVTFTRSCMQINFNSLDLRIPIPTNGAKKELQATDKIIDKLLQAGYKKSYLEKIIIGYKVCHDTNKTSNLIDLIPTYYIKINGRWHSLDAWLNNNYEVHIHASQQGGISNGF